MQGYGDPCVNDPGPFDEAHARRLARESMTGRDAYGLDREQIVALFGEPARVYASHVPHFWPRLTPWRSGDDKVFSWARVTSNREWPWGLVLAGVLAAIWTVDIWSPFSGLLQ